MTQVYFVRIGKHIKIGVTTNLPARMAMFSTGSADIELLLAMPGNRELEQQIHQLLAECRLEREIFRPDWRIGDFIIRFEHHGIEQALQFLEETTPAARSKKKENERQYLLTARRQSKAEKDTYFASLVAHRKERLGW